MQDGRDRDGSPFHEPVPVNGPFTAATRPGKLLTPVNLLAGAVLLVACIACLLTAPTDGDFWWSDAPRHGLNGLFLRDLIIQHPLHDPVSWAFGYYARRPALTILFYPPLFYVTEAIAFLAFGFSHVVAQSVVTAFLFLLGISTFGLARFYTGRGGAVAAMLLAIGMPETAFWGRQVMLDIPAYALATTSAWLMMAYIRSSRRAALYGCAAVLLAAIYTKYNAGFVAIPLAVTLVACRGWRSLLDRHVLATAAVSAVALIPAILLMRMFGAQNFASVAGLEGMPTPGSLAYWTYYIRILPHQMGWTLALLVIPAVAVMAMALARGERVYALPLSWLGFGYLFYTLISLKEPRDTLMVLLPVAIGVPVLAARLLARPFAPGAAMAYAAAVFIWTIAFDPVPFISGYQDIAAWLAGHAPKDALIVYSGPRDGILVFDLAQQPASSDMAVVRADKLLLSVPVGERRRGVHEEPYSEAQIAAMLRDLSPDYVVVQPDFWADLKEIGMFLKIVDGPDYERVAEFHLHGALSTMDGAAIIDIMKPKQPTRSGNRRLDIDMPLLGRRLRSAIGP